MPNTFKNSITNITNTNQTSCYTAPSSSGDVGIVVGLLISNDDASNDTTATVAITDTSASATRNILNTVTIPQNTALEVCRGNKFVLEAGDILKVTKGSSGSGLNITVSVLEIT